MSFSRGVNYACLVAVLCIGAAAAFAEDAKQPKVTTNVAGGCPDYCGDSKCSTINHEVVCGEIEDHTALSLHTCASISSYYQRGTKCCTRRTRCCTYWDRNNNPRTYWQDEGETMGCD
jgi:hypothetical protein